MAYYAKLNENNVVVDVIVADAAFVAAVPGNWIKEDPNGVSPKNFAGRGYTYDSYRDAFIPVKPFNSWILNPETCNWDAPVAKPDDGGVYVWDEAALNWKLVE